VSGYRNPLKINVGFLLNQAVGTSRDIHFDQPELRLSSDFILLDFKGTARVGRTPQGILVQAEFTASLKAECVRCLAEYQQPLQASFKELFAFDTRSVTESGLFVPEDGNIDLAPLVREFSLLEMPIKPLCKVDCKGLCVVCGEDLNTTACGHVKQQEV
jgi:uncharacterized protein